MMLMTTAAPGARFRAAVAAEAPLQVPGTICAYHAILAEKTGFKAIYLSGFGASAFNIARTVRTLCGAGAAAMHIEDQVGAKRCGHRPGKELVSAAEMV